MKKRNKKTATGITENCWKSLLVCSLKTIWHIYSFSTIFYARTKRQIPVNQPALRIVSLSSASRAHMVRTTPTFFSFKKHYLNASSAEAIVSPSVYGLVPKVWFCSCWNSGHSRYGICFIVSSLCALVGSVLWCGISWSPLCHLELFRSCFVLIRTCPFSVSGVFGEPTICLEFTWIIYLHVPAAFHIPILSINFRAPWLFNCTSASIILFLIMYIKVETLTLIYEVLNVFQRYEIDVIDHLCYIT